MRVTTAIALTILAALPLGGADYRIVQEVETAGVPGRSGAFRQVLLLSGENLRAESPGQVVILRPDLGTVYLLDPDSREYVEMKMEAFRSMTSALGGPLSGMGGEPTLDVTGRTRNIGRWKAREVRVSQSLGEMGGIEIEAWISSEVGVDLDRFQGLTEALDPFAGLARKIREAGGYPVESRVTLSIMGQKMETLQRLVSVEEAALEPALFAVPEGWTATELPLEALGPK